MARTIEKRNLNSESAFVIPEIEVVSFRDYVGQRDSSLLGFATVRIGQVVVSGIQLVSGRNGAFCNMPQEKGSDGKYYNKVWIDTGSKEFNKDVYNAITKAVKEFYEAE